MEPLVSVVIPVRDDPAGLANVLAALRRQTLARERFELVVAVDGGPVPGVPPGVRLVTGPPRNSYAARNRGARAARGHVLAFTDADCLPAPDWLERGLAALDGADLVAGAVRFATPARPSRWALIDLERYLDQAAQARRGRAATANLFVRRHVLERLGGFDETLPSGGDHGAVLRATRAGARLRHAADVVVEHPTRDRARPLLRKAWFTTYHGAVRAVRDREPRERLEALLFLPGASGVAERLRDGRPLTRLSPERLEQSRARPSRRAQLAALAAFYALIAPLTLVARTAGAARGLWLRWTTAPAGATLQ